MGQCRKQPLCLPRITNVVTLSSELRLISVRSCTKQGRWAMPRFLKPWMTQQFFLRLLVLLALMTIGGCAQIEMYRLQGEVEDLREQLEYERQRLKQANELADFNPNQPVKQRKSAKVCKPHTIKGVDTRSSNCISGRKVVK